MLLDLVTAKFLSVVTSRFLYLATYVTDSSYM